MQENPDADIFFFDEARFGTHSNLGYGWFKKGTRTGIKVKIGYQNFYVYGAVNPASGEHFELILPKVNTQCMNIFLSEFSRKLGKKKCIFIMDGAGWHKSKDLKIPPNLIVNFLPAYSPELNPIERLWPYIKQNTIKNRIYYSLKSLENRICEFINELKMGEISSVCGFNYMFN
jgi:transposase